MGWEYELIFTYVNICEAWEKGISCSVKRYSNNNSLALSDEEIACLYLYGIISGQTTVKGIYTFSYNHLRGFFPNLGSYESFNYRLNRISDAFINLTEHMSEIFKNYEHSVDIAVDSFPIILAGPKRSQKAKVAPNLANKGYCASKGLYFYGVKLHCIGKVRSGTLPFPTHLGLAPASENDNKMFEQISPVLENVRTFADKAYSDATHKMELQENQNVELLTPRKKIKGLFTFRGGDTFSRWVSSIRQPIESLFNWIQEKTKMQNASKVRSNKGLITHVFGRLAAAVLLLSMKHF